MAVKHLIKTSAIALIAAMVAVPAAAQDGRGWGNRGGGNATAEARAEARAERVQQREARQAPQAEARAQSNGGNGGGWRARAESAPAQVQVERQAPVQAQAAPRWGSQRPADGERRGRDWSNDGTVNRPAPAWRGATPATPDRGVEARTETTRTYRNGTYSDANRSGSYRDGRRDGDRTATWQGGRTDQTRRDGDRYRGTDRTWSGSRDGYRSTDRTWSGSRDGRRSGYNTDYNRWNRDSWRRDHRYNWSSYRSQHRSLFSIGGYYSPYRNYYYRPLSIGFYLDSLFYSDRYWINDPWQYRLPDVYGPYRWVRYYDDVLLVDIYSGEVVDVIHNFFY